MRGGLSRAQWMDRAWTFYDAAGPLHRGYTIKAEVIAKVRIYAAWQESPDDEPVPIDEALDSPDLDTFGLNDYWASLAQGAVARVQSADGGQPEVLRQLALNLDVAGLGWLLARDDGWAEDWQVLSCDQVRWQDGWVYYDTPSTGSTTSGRPIKITPDDVLLKVWRKHPRFPVAADSAFRAMLDDLEQMQQLRSEFTSASTSRMALNGVLLVDSNIDLPSTPDRDADYNTADGFYETLLEAGTTAIRDPASAAAHMPIVAQIEGSTDRKISEAMHHQTFDHPMYEAQVRQEQDLWNRILQSADFPPEWVTGLGTTSTYANARIVSSEGYSQDVDPTVRLICAALTSAWVRWVLRDQGCPEEVVQRIVVDRDPDTVIAKPDRYKFASQVAMQPPEQRVLTNEAIRSATGFDEGDAPDEDEIADEAAVPALPAADDEDTGPNVGDPDVLEAASWPAPVPLVAAATPKRLTRLSGQLARIDQRYLARLHVACDRAVSDGVNRAGAAVRARAQGSKALKARLRGVPACQVVSVLTDDQRATLAVGDADLEGSLDVLRGQFDTWTAQAQAQARKAAALTGDWPDDVDDQVAVRQDDDRDAGWAWLAAGLLALMSERLTVGEIRAPEFGEFDPNVTVPFGISRAAAAVAGGATLDPIAVSQGQVLAADGAPAGAIGDGRLILATLENVSSVTTESYVWVHGGAPRPFEPHLLLDGEPFDSWESNVLAADAGDFPYVGHYYDGDHDGCSCSAEHVLVVSD